MSDAHTRQRLVATLQKVRDGFQQSLDYLPVTLIPDPAGSEWPGIRVLSNDITEAVAYLNESGLTISGDRLRAEFQICQRGWMCEFLAALAVRRPQEAPLWLAEAVGAPGAGEDYRAWLKERFGAFPDETDPNDPAVQCRRRMLAGKLVTLLGLLDELIATVKTNDAEETSTIDPEIPKGQKRRYNANASGLVLPSLLDHHRYEYDPSSKDSVGNYEPISLSELEERYKVTKSVASRWFKENFGSHAEYQGACGLKWKLRDKLKKLNQDTPDAWDTGADLDQISCEPMDEDEYDPD